MASDGKKRKGEGLDAAVEDLVSWVADTWHPWKPPPVHPKTYMVWRTKSLENLAWDAKGVEAEVEGNWGRIQGRDVVGTGRLENFHHWDSSSIPGLPCVLHRRVATRSLRQKSRSSRNSSHWASKPGSNFVIFVMVRILDAFFLGGGGNYSGSWLHRTGRRRTLNSKRLCRSNGRHKPLVCTSGVSKGIKASIADTRHKLATHICN